MSTLAYWSWNKFIKMNTPEIYVIKVFCNNSNHANFIPLYLWNVAFCRAQTNAAWIIVSIQWLKCMRWTILLSTLNIVCHTEYPRNICYTHTHTHTHIYIYIYIYIYVYVLNIYVVLDLRWLNNEYEVWFIFINIHHEPRHKRIKVAS